MSKAQDDTDRGIPTRELHEAYRKRIRARDQYVQVLPYGPGARHEAQRALHAAVSNYYEALRSVSSNISRADKYWDGSKQHHLWTEQHYVVQTDDGDIPIEDIPQDALTDEVLQATTTVTEYVGLDVLEDLWATVDYDTKTYQDATGAHQSTVERSTPLPPEILQQTAHLLDKLASDLGLLADIKESTPRTEITDEMIEEVEAWRKQNLE